MDRLITKLMIENVLRTPAVIAAFTAVDRADFVPESLVDDAYEDRPLPLLSGQTISQPTTVAFMLEQLQVETGQRIVDVGSGSGWTTALLAELVGPDGRVFGREVLPELVEYGASRLDRYDFPWADIALSGEQLGLPSEAPLDRILVSAAATHLPDELVRQLAIGGRMVIPVGNELQVVTRRSTDPVDIEVERFPGFAFVPLHE